MTEYKWPSQNEIDELNKLFQFPAIGDEQDWGIEFSDLNRINEFLESYESGKLTAPQKMAVMELIIASFDELLYLGKDDPQLWKRIANHLNTEKDLHKYTLSYWACYEDQRDIFPTTERIREIHKHAF